MNIKISTAICLSVLCWFSCKSDPASVTPEHVEYDHPLAPAGLSRIYIDGVQYPFLDNFDYSEYYEGAELKDEYSYYLDRGHHSVLNIDLNADSEYLSLLLLDASPTLGTYQIMDTVLPGIAQLSYRFNDSITNILKQRTVSGLFEITNVDTVHKRMSGIFNCTVETKSNGKRYSMQGSFTDVYFRFGEAGGQVMTADIGGAGWTSGFASTHLYDAFGNEEGQGYAKKHFAIVMKTDESHTSGYESFALYLPEPLHTGSYDMTPGLAIYSKYRYDTSSGGYALTLADTNRATANNAVIVTDFDTVRRRISGTFDFILQDGSSRSPIGVHNGKFIDLFY